jgi:apolipoprotein N-acyltransferase
MVANQDVGSLGYGRRSGVVQRKAPTGSAGHDRLHRLGLIVLSTVLLSLAYAPFGQWYLAWVAMVPWLAAMGSTRSARTAFGWGYLSGVAFFGANLWWMWTASISGTVALCLYFGLYWALAAFVIRGLGLLGAGGNDVAAEAKGRSGPGGRQLLRSVVLISAVWVSTEWLRANVARGFPWMFLGHSQSPMPVLCQIADAIGVLGISACIMLTNGLAAIALRPLHRWRPLAMPAAVVAVICVAVAVYGWFRIWQTRPVPGPRVMVVQSDYQHRRGGERTVSRETAIAFHVETTVKALAAAPVDLVLWSEAVAPPLNAEAREELSRTAGGRFMERTHQQIAEIAERSGTALVTGAYWVGGWKREGGIAVGTDIRNSAYLYIPGGSQPSARYDKTELALFSERVPFRDSSALLHRMMLWLSPPVASQALTPGDRKATTVFAIRVPETPTSASTQSAVSTRPAGLTPPATYRFVTPICLENIFPDYIAGLIGAGGGSGKRADFIANLSNDGWFSPMERHQHLQQVIFRCIENRVPQVRASNTGISGFIDSCGRVFESLPAGVEGTAVAVLPLDDRTTLYARYGEWFAWVYLAISLAAVLARVLAGRLGRSR